MVKRLKELGDFFDLYDVDRTLLPNRLVSAVNAYIESKIADSEVRHLQITNARHKAKIAELKADIKLMKEKDYKQKDIHKKANFI